jgi:4-aminobutyrate aminotransferase-like enzyme/Ser/Thr protein kinase RdoA (MazF antagonist)
MTETAISSPRPSIDLSEAARVLDRLYGLHGSLEELPGELDRNFLVTVAPDQRFVLKIYGTAANAEVLDFQNAALAHIALHDQALPVPRVVPDRSGNTTAETGLADGTTRLVRMLTWLPGRTMGGSGPSEPQLLRSLGEFLARLDRALEDFRHAAMERPLLWALTSAPEHRKLLVHIEDPQRRELAGAILAKFENTILPFLRGMRRQVVHHDANDYNILIDDHRRVSGLIDFGDMVAGPTIAELAVAIAYAMFGHADPIKAVLPLVAGYHDVNPLSEVEIDLLLDLVRTRLAQSVCMSSWQFSRDRGNTYLLISQKDAWALLEKLASINERFARYQLRDACGLPGNPDTPKIVAWLGQAGDRIGPLCRHDLRRDKGLVFDWSAESPDLKALEALPDIGSRSDHLFERMRQAGAVFGVGRYREDRTVYRTELFAVAAGEERRTVHLGIDLFLPAGEAILAPLAGRVHLLENNRAEGDYGPLIVLEHQTDEGTKFWTLYGHLAEKTLTAHKIGDRVERGETIAWVGTYPTNGNWIPHLHFQLITDFVGRGADLEGVVKRSEIDVWESLCPDPNIILGIPDAVSTIPPRAPDYLLAQRRRHLSPSLSLSYAEPLKIVRGRGQFLYDENGRAWLDMVNNVAHVGHCHPRVVAAGQAQMAELNTNTRYLHDNVVDFARRLTATLPDPLRVCFFVNSGSEANDLAIRLARAYTGQRDILAVDVAYHGNLSSLVDISPYKFDGPGGKGRPPQTWVCAKPDGYRGALKYGTPSLGSRYAEEVGKQIAAVRAEGRGVAAFFCESVLSCAGQVVLPQGYLAAAYEQVRAAGGLCVADEVQVGFGRVGTHMWGFETQGVVPDIVTMGKPIGNGHPVAAVVTTREIATAFANGMEYFNTFGGNPVSAAIGIAVLDVIRDEHLQHHSLTIGRRLIEGLESLKQRHPLIGDVRGLGLFVGIEFVRDRATLEPAAKETKAIVEAMKRRGMLLSIDGPLYNVIKIKPPLVFDQADCDRFLSGLDEVLSA